MLVDDFEPRIQDPTGPKGSPPVGYRQEVQSMGDIAVTAPTVQEEEAAWSLGLSEASAFDLGETARGEQYVALFWGKPAGGSRERGNLEFMMGICRHFSHKLDFPNFGEIISPVGPAFPWLPVETAPTRDTW